MLPLGVESLFQKGTDSRRWALGSFFWWLNTLMRTGFRRVLSNEDLYPIEDSMTSRVLLNRGQEVWKNADKTRQRALIGFRYAQPFLISRTVNFASSPEEPESIGWALTGAFGLVFLGLAIATGSYYHMTYRYVTTVRGTLVGMIYSKTMDLSITALDESVAVTLMARYVLMFDHSHRTN
jgi:ATP-binding cassette subfamily C (CFTR/MRP) protein 1